MENNKVRRLIEIENEINQKKSRMEALRSRYAMPYYKSMKRQYAWTNQSAKIEYDQLSNEIGTLLIEKRNLEK